MPNSAPFAALVAAAVALPASAEGPVALTYAEFEAAVPHLDMEECPAGMAEGDVFCRLTMNNDALHVFVFEIGGEQRCVAVRSFHDGEFDLVLKR